MPAALSLTKQVTGRLSDTEDSIIKVLAEGGDTWRTTVSLEAQLALSAVRGADREKRDFSNFVGVALQEFCQAHGEPTPEQSAAVAEIQTALVEHPEILPGIKKLIAEKRRSKRRVAA